MLMSNAPTDEFISTYVWVFTLHFTNKTSKKQSTHILFKTGNNLSLVTFNLLTSYISMYSSTNILIT